MVAMTVRPANRYRIACLAWSAIWSLAIAETSPVCPARPAASDPCVPIASWGDLTGAIESATDELVLCPFTVEKDNKSPVFITKGLAIQCRKAKDDEVCEIRGLGVHFAFASTQDTLVQGLDFRGSDEHAVYIRAETGIVEHTFCECEFLGNKRLDSTRGGAFKTETGSGIVNIISSTFKDNFSNYGGAIYNRSKLMRVIRSRFINNEASEFGAAIFCARHASISISSSTFINNEDSGGHVVVVKPYDGDGEWFDGGDNISIENSGCLGFFIQVSGTCAQFAPTDRGVTDPTHPSFAPSLSASPATSAEPSGSMVPSNEPTTSEYPSITPSLSPSTSPSESQWPSSLPSISPTTSFPSLSPSQHPSASLRPSISQMPSASPTSVATSLCSDLDPFQQQYQSQCINISSWGKFIDIVEQSSGLLVLCPFFISKTDISNAYIDNDLDLVCAGSNKNVTSLCTIDGPGAHLKIRGQTQVTVSGFVFRGSDDTAVHVLTSEPWAVTSLCWCQFIFNQRSSGDEGGAVTTQQGSGVVNLVDSIFWYNAGRVGGAILSRSYKLTVVGSTFVANFANETASAIYSAPHSHLLVRGTSFVFNYAETVNLDIVVNPVSNSGIQGVVVDAGGNQAVNSGECDGFYSPIVLDPLLGNCQAFDGGPALPSAIYPYVPGDLSVHDEDTGIALSTGLTIRKVAQSGEKVKFKGGRTALEESAIPFHVAPDGAAIVSASDGGWIYVSNSESTLGDGMGGVYALVFDRNGEIRDYRQLLANTTRNCNGGLTPWKTWISCEEYSKGQCWQVDPFGLREAEMTVLGEADGGNFEAFTYDDRDPDNKAYFVTEDHPRGALRRFRPDTVPGNDDWDTLHGPGTHDYLKILPGTGKFEWTPSLEEGRQSAEVFYPNTEGISHKGGILYFASKKARLLYICNLETMEYRVEMFNQKPLLGRGEFKEEADHLVQISKDVLYFTEDGGRTPGVYATYTATGQYFAIMEASSARFKNDEATGLSFSPDWKRMYVCLQEAGILYEIRRKDGEPFEHTGPQLHLKYHSGTDTHNNE